MPEGQEILSVAIWKPAPGMEAASLETIHEISSILQSKGYGRDHLYRDFESHYVLLRYWTSAEARITAQEDPDLLRRWARLGNEIEIVKVFETLADVPER